MTRRNIMIALGALVAGASALVYAERDTGPTRNISAEAAADVTITGAAPTASQAGNPKVLYNFDALPDPVKRMLRQIASAAESGDIGNSTGSARSRSRCFAATSASVAAGSSGRAAMP